MKKTLFTLSAAVLLLTANAQNKTVEHWPNGTKKSEGIVIGDNKVDATASKEQQSRQSVTIIKDGKWSTWHENGTLRSEENYNQGIMTGAWKAWYENGQVESEINFTTGKASFYHKNGKKQSEGTMANGMVTTGKWTGYYENGNKNYEGTYASNGQKDGTWNWFDETGKATTIQIYKNGDLVK
ncbi:MAG TPA: hypothetical protein VGC65_02340 [Bacteroidia bacterium]